MKKNNKGKIGKSFAPAPTKAAQAAERAAAIAALHMAPEDGTAEGRYATTTGELVRWVKEGAPTPSGPDIRVVDEGSVVLFQPETDAAQRWLKANLVSEGWQWMGRSLAVQSSYAANIIDGARSDGLTVAS